MSNGEGTIALIKHHASSEKGNYRTQSHRPLSDEYVGLTDTGHWDITS